MRPHVSVFVRVHPRAPVCKLFISGWFNFCTLVGHFSKLFEFAGLNRLKTFIFLLKSGCFLKKKGLHLESISEIRIFVPKSRCFPKKKKRSSLGIDFRNSYFHRKIIAFSKKRVAAACDRQDLCKIVPRARSWTTLTYIMTIPQRPQ